MRIDCEFHYYHPELIKYLTGQHTAPRYFPETKVLELREGAASKFSTVTNTYPLIDELTDFGERRVAEMDKNGIDVGVMGVSPAHEEMRSRGTRDPTGGTMASDDRVGSRVPRDRAGGTMASDDRVGSRIPRDRADDLVKAAIMTNG